MKKLLVIIGLCILLAAALYVYFFILNPSPTPKDLQNAVGQTLPLSQATPLVCELADADLSDDFSKAFMDKATITVLSINEEGTSATVKFSAPDIGRILQSNLPTDTTGDYEALFAQYWANVTAALANAAPEDMITQTVECPVVEQEEGKQISVANTQIFDYQQELADALLEILLESEG